MILLYLFLKYLRKKDIAITTYNKKSFFLSNIEILEELTEELLDYENYKSNDYIIYELNLYNFFKYIVFK